MTVSLRQIRTRIRSTENTRAVTRAMEMVSVAKLGKCLEGLRQARRFSAAQEAVAARTLGAGAHPWLRSPSPGSPVFLFVIAGDAGLCGGYNDAVIRMAAERAAALERKPEVFTVGKKAFEHFSRRGYAVTGLCPELRGKPSAGAVEELFSAVTACFTGTEGSEVDFAYTEFLSPGNCSPRMVRLLPCAAEAAGGYAIYEPGRRGFLDSFLPSYVRGKVALFLLESLSSEHSSRASSMKKAADNARELAERLVLAGNRMRQAMITREMIELVSAVEAQKG